MQLDDLRRAKDRLLSVSQRQDDRMAPALILNTPEEVDSTTSGYEQAALSDEPLTISALHAEDDGLEEGEVSVEQMQLLEAASADGEDMASDLEGSCEDLSPGEIMVAEAANSSTSIDTEVFGMDDTKQGRTLPSEAGSISQHEALNALKVRILLVCFLIEFFYCCATNSNLT